jgi:hypothetical protein
LSRRTEGIQDKELVVVVLVVVVVVVAIVVTVVLVVVTVRVVVEEVVAVAIVVIAVVLQAVLYPFVALEKIGNSVASPFDCILYQLHLLFCPPNS